MNPESSARPHVVAIVLNWCAVSDTAACLDSLLRSRYPSLTTLLVDNGSPDGSGEELARRYPDLPYLQTGSNRGYAGGNNAGITWALEQGADYVLVLNNDTVVEPECVSELVAAAECSSDVGAVGAKILFFDAPDRVWFAGGDVVPARASANHRREGERDDPVLDRGVEEVTFLTGCCLLMPARALRAVGAFDESYFAYVEDLDLSVRLRAAGLRLLYTPRARLLHRVPLDGVHPSPFQIRMRDRNRRRLARAHYRGFARARFYVWYFASRFARAVQYLIGADPRRARAIVQGALGK